MADDREKKCGQQPGQSGQQESQSGQHGQGQSHQFGNKSEQTGQKKSGLGTDEEDENRIGNAVHRRRKLDIKEVPAVVPGLLFFLVLLGPTFAFTQPPRSAIRGMCSLRWTRPARERLAPSARWTGLAVHRSQTELYDGSLRG